MEQKNNITHSSEEITIQNWEHFNKVCWKLEGYGSDSTDTVIFRGQKDKDYDDGKLTPSLYREIIERGVGQQKIYDIEKALITAFVQMWFPPEMKSYIEHHLLFQILSVMQHYGMKTRMLDWTFSWKVAAYFATESHPKLDEKDAAVWYINRTQVEKRFKEFCGEEYDRRSLHRGISSLNNYNLCWTNENECPAKQPDSRIQCNAIFFKDVPSTSTDVRMIVQASVFTYCSNPLVDHIECIAKVLGEDTEKYCKKMIIPKELKLQFRNQLKTQLESPGEKLFPIINQDDNKKTFEEIMSKYQEK